MVCAQEGEILKVLFEKGAAIEEINTLRKHLSLARGGRLAEYAYPATSLALIFSDVPGDDPGFVASGPTVKDETTVDEARAIVQKYDLEKEAGLKIEPLKTPKEDKYFEKVKNVIFVSNRTALIAMTEKAREVGLHPEVRTSLLAGEARKVGERIAAEIGEAMPKTAYLYAGETTVTIKGNGRGGRNQELALGALAHIGAGSVVLSLASDGRDNGDYGGALCDTITKEKAAALGLKEEEYLARNDSSGFFEKTGGLLMTGDTGANVSDLIIAVKQ
jgi:glycerate 2-kinase